MTEYEQIIFNARCPYTDELCVDKIPCTICRADEQEKELMRRLNEQERLDAEWSEE